MHVLNYITTICLAILRTRDFTFYRFVFFLRFPLLATDSRLSPHPPTLFWSFNVWILIRTLCGFILFCSRSHHFLSPSFSIRAHRLHNCTNKFLFAHFYQNLIFTLHFSAYGFSSFARCYFLFMSLLVWWITFGCVCVLFRRWCFHQYVMRCYCCTLAIAWWHFPLLATEKFAYSRCRRNWAWWPRSNALFVHFVDEHITHILVMHILVARTRWQRLKITLTTNNQPYSWFWESFPP